ncbi:TetR/AcrR family transcriptional regulator [Clostridium sp. OS1-26]|uniref:TetR/AcrR family transcriptional regulator n=1 Tax=Clostridium sp. OS1-26 TaxID=3070681 RepID=UPI0027DEE1F6|nr:TetR/AcrR family transcriptional regulator [Clostridium sp. OS1-26]WML32787.1 TetR/AcrR family transcriptional regulator [Clostridium sp. OS1-26]
MVNSITRREKEKQAREEDIINAAEKIFTIMGYNGASMEEIAKEAQFTRKTVYQYFADKEDLYFAVVIRGFKRLLCYIQKESKKENTGFEKLQLLGSAYYRFYQDFPSSFHLMNYVGYIKSNKENTNKREEFNKASELVAQEVAKVIDEGKADGSIRNDLNTMKATYSAEFLITGFFHMLSLSGKTFTNHYSLDQQDFIHFNLNLLFDAFRKKNK